MPNMRNYEASPVSDELDLKNVILGLSRDLAEMRSGVISPQEALARAAVAKQLFNGVRLYLQAVKMVETSAKTLPDALNAERDDT